MWFVLNWHFEAFRMKSLLQHFKQSKWLEIIKTGHTLLRGCTYDSHTCCDHMTTLLYDHSNKRSMVRYPNVAFNFICHDVVNWHFHISWLHLFRASLATCHLTLYKFSKWPFNRKLCVRSVQAFCPQGPHCGIIFLPPLPAIRTILRKRW